MQALSSTASITEADLVLLLVKSQATRAAVQDVAHLMSDTCPLLCLQTGLGNLEVAREFVHESHILLGITYMSGIALSDARVRKGSLAKTYIGELDGTFSSRLETISLLFNRCGLETEMVPDILSRLWSKVIIYAAVNPISAILQVPNGSLVSRTESITLMKRLLDEGMAVAKAQGVVLGDPDLYEVLFETCEKNANNLSSMLQDILNEASTEIDAQNGAICHYAEEHGISVPTHRTMVELIKLLECWKPGLGQS